MGITVPADVPAPYSAGTSAGTVMTKIWSYIEGEDQDLKSQSNQVWSQQKQLISYFTQCCKPKDSIWIIASNL